VQATQSGELRVTFAQIEERGNIKRKGDDLLLTHSISLEDALLSSQIEVENIDGEKIKILIDEMITP
jgi:DnaJ-class molecular chaperone